MELKLLERYDYQLPRILLIVPYGIETLPNGRAAKGVMLLIVPYGIETTL